MLDKALLQKQIRSNKYTTQELANNLGKVIPQKSETNVQETSDAAFGTYVYCG